jgi:hypothetical protein
MNEALFISTPRTKCGGAAVRRCGSLFVKVVSDFINLGTNPIGSGHLITTQHSDTFALSKNSHSTDGGLYKYPQNRSAISGQSLPDARNPLSISGHSLPNAWNPLSISGHSLPDARNPLSISGHSLPSLQNRPAA